MVMALPLLTGTAGCGALRGDIRIHGLSSKVVLDLHFQICLKHVTGKLYLSEEA